MSEPFIGEIRAVGFNFVPEGGWLLCDGKQYPVSLSQYQALYSLLGNTFGGNSTAFNVPDLRYRSMVGSGASPSLQNESINLGQQLGALTATLAVTNLPPHNHAAAVNDPGHTHSVAVPAHTHPFAVPCAPSGGNATETDPNGNSLCNTAAIESVFTSAGSDPGPLPLYVSGVGSGSMAAGTTGSSSPAAGSTGTSGTGIAVTTGFTGSGAPVDIGSPVLGVNFIIAYLGIYPTRQ